MNRRSFMSLGTGIAVTGFGGVNLSSLYAEEPRKVGPTVETAAGKVRGLTIGRVHCFKGIPYGASTEGTERFMPPVKPQSWAGVRDMFDLGARAPQLPGCLVPEYAVMEDYGPTSEDCLLLNVWTPGANNRQKRPVMVWFHGGGFSVGSGGCAVYDGTNLAAKHDVVVVTVNHRLNVFGYLYLTDLGGDKYVQTSNLGMLDLIASLKWVRDNIEKFGGDSRNVTIFGQSGGGRKVSTLMAMPAAKGLFHRAIAMSGSAVRLATREQATQSAQKILAKAGLERTQIDDLQKLTKNELLELWRGTGELSPVVDGHSLPEHPFDPVASSVSADIPLIIGSTETEVTFNPNQMYDPLDDSELHNALKQLLHSADPAVDEVIAIYKKDRPQASNLDIYLIAASDVAMGPTGRVAVNTEADRKSALAKAPVYKYYFQWYSPVRNGMLRAMHTMDIPFAFDNVDIAASEVGNGPERQPLADKISRAYVAFARTGNPNHPDIPNWPAFNTNDRPTMVWNNECRVVNSPYREERTAILRARATSGVKESEGT